MERMERFAFFIVCGRPVTMRFKPQNVVLKTLCAAFAVTIIATLTVGLLGPDLCDGNDHPDVLPFLEEHGLRAVGYYDVCISTAGALTGICIAWIATIISLITGIIYLIWAIKEMSTDNAAFRAAISDRDETNTPREQRDIERAQAWSGREAREPLDI